MQAERAAERKPSQANRFGSWKFFFLLVCVLACPAAFAEGGPPCHANDLGTHGNHNWEIKFAYMPFEYTNQFIAHTPDVEVNLVLGDRIQLTFENARLRVIDPSSPPKYGLGQDQLGVKRRYCNNEQSGFAISVLPQVSLNNPNQAADRGITPRSGSVILSVEFSKKLGPLSLNWEVGYNVIHAGGDG